MLISQLLLDKKLVNLINSHCTIFTHTLSKTGAVLPICQTAPPAVDVKNADVSIVLPTDTDCDTILDNMSILFARVVRKRFNFFKDSVQP